MRIRKPGKVWLPQGTAVHAGVEHLLNDLSAGIQRDKEYYELMAEVAWDEQVERSNGVVYDKKGNPMNSIQVDSAIEEAKYWLMAFMMQCKTVALSKASTLVMLLKQK